MYQVWDPEGFADTSGAALQHRHKLTPYEDEALQGRVEATYVRGKQVFSRGILSPKACGAPVLKGAL